MCIDGHRIWLHGQERCLPVLKPLQSFIEWFRVSRNFSWWSLHSFESLLLNASASSMHSDQFLSLAPYLSAFTAWLFISLVISLKIILDKLFASLLVVDTNLLILDLDNHLVLFWKIILYHLWFCFNYKKFMSCSMCLDGIYWKAKDFGSFQQLLLCTASNDKKIFKNTFYSTGFWTLSFTLSFRKKLRSGWKNLLLKTNQP